MNIEFEKMKRFPKLGNYIICIINALHYAKFYNYNFKLPSDHEIVKDDYIVFNNNILINNEPTLKIGIITDFYKSTFIKNVTFDESLFKINHSQVVDKLQSILKIQLHETFKVDCLIHVRSGDIFKSDVIHKNYAQPPLHYYVEILKQNTFENIYLIAEDTLNPVINQLCNLFPNIIFKLQNLEDDIKQILCAKTIISGIGTFIPSILLCDSKCRTLYSSKENKFYKPYFAVKKIHVITLPYDDYYNKMGEWKNSDEQRDLMIKYVK